MLTSTNMTNSLPIINIAPFIAEANGLETDSAEKAKVAHELDQAVSIHHR
jgi:hypothetical protein